MTINGAVRSIEESWVQVAVTLQARIAHPPRRHPSSPPKRNNWRWDRSTQEREAAWCLTDLGPVRLAVEGAGCRVGKAGWLPHLAQEPIPAAGTRPP